MYTKQTWKNGDVITEDKLNHIEDGISTGGGIYTYGYEEVSLFDGNVATAKVQEDAPAVSSDLTLQGELPKTDISVTFNGQDYILPYNNQGFIYYGEAGNEGPVFNNFPLVISPDRNDALLFAVFTESEGTYSLKIKKTVEKIEVNDSFASAIANAGAVLIVNANENRTLDKTWQEIHDAPLAVIKSIPDNNHIGTGIVVTTSISGGDYNVEDNGGTIYTADSAEGYPANSIG